MPIDSLINSPLGIPRFYSPETCSRSLSVLLAEALNRSRLAVITLAPQPAHKGTLQQLGVEPIRLGPPMLARHRHARRVDYMRLNAACFEPARQPEAVAAGLEGHGDARDLVSRPHSFIAPAIEQCKESILICL